MKYKRHKKIGRAPLPYVTCRVCFAQIRHDGMFPSPLEAHFQQEHPGEYEQALSNIENGIRKGEISYG